MKGERSFCCAGCLTVHELLTGSGLGHFYELGAAPGVRARAAGGREEWSYLDEPALQRQLLDFTDGEVSKVTLKVPQVHCVACVWLLENLYRLHPGVGRSQVNFPRREVTLLFSPGRIRLSELVALLASIGYEPVLTLGELDPRPRDPTRRRRWLQVGIAGFGFGNIMLLSLPQYLGLDSLSGPLFRQVFGYLSLALALPVAVYSAADYWKSAVASVRQRILTLDVPIALGLVALYAESAWEILGGRGEGYLDSLTGLVFFLLCGRVFQHVTQERLTFDRDYRAFFPLVVHRRTPGQALEENISIAQLRVGDRVLIRHGELVPADAVLREGPARIDYSFVTGESAPVTKNAGDYLYAGGRQLDGAIEVEIVRAVSQSYLASLWDHAAFRKDRDGGFQTVTNRFSRRFTVAVLLVAAGTAVLWSACGNPTRGLQSSIAVLIVACPCALALAAPFALGTAQRWLARAGVFLRNALVLERLARVDMVVFDKTGTLTTSDDRAVTFDGWHEAAPAGQPPGPGLPPPPAGLSEVEARWIASLARHSAHPHAVQLAEALADPRTLPRAAGFRETPGGGIEARIEGHEVWLGSQAWLESRGLRAGRSTGTPDAGTGSRGPVPAPGSQVWVAIDGRCRGVFTLANALRPEVEALVRELTGRYQLALLSGDHAWERARFRALFPDDAGLHFGQSPRDKLEFIARLQRSGRVVMMVGDGLNDAGALRQSDAGVAVVGHAGAFSPASDVILEAGQLPGVAQGLRLARRAVRTVRWSFVLSAAYNLVGVSVAAAGQLSPLVAAVLMPLSSLSVVVFACGATTRAALRMGVGGGVARVDGPRIPA